MIPLAATLLALLSDLIVGSRAKTRPAPDWDEMKRLYLQRLTNENYSEIDDAFKMYIRSLGSKPEAELYLVYRDEEPFAVAHVLNRQIQQ